MISSERLWSYARRTRENPPEHHVLMLEALRELFRGDEHVFEPNDQRLDIRGVVYRIPVAGHVYHFGIPHLRIVIQYESKYEDYVQQATHLRLYGWRLLVIRPERYAFRRQPIEDLREDIQDAIHPFDAKNDRWKPAPPKPVVTSCECGCGKKPRRGKRFLSHHHLQARGGTAKRVRGEVSNCECGCGGHPKDGRRFLRGHYLKAKYAGTAKPA